MGKRKAKQQEEQESAEEKARRAHFNAGRASGQVVVTGAAQRAMRHLFEGHGLEPNSKEVGSWLLGFVEGVITSAGSLMHRIEHDDIDFGEMLIAAVKALETGRNEALMICHEVGSLLGEDDEEAKEDAGGQTKH